MVSPDGVAPRQMVGVSASINHPLHHKVQKFSSGTGTPGGPGKRATKQVCVCTNFTITSITTTCLVQQPFSRYVISPTTSSVVLEKNLLNKVALLPSLVYV